MLVLSSGSLKQIIEMQQIVEFASSRDLVEIVWRDHVLVSVRRLKYEGNVYCFYVIPVEYVCLVNKVIGEVGYYLVFAMTCITFLMNRYFGS